MKPTTEHTGDDWRKNPAPALQRIRDTDARIVALTKSVAQRTGHNCNYVISRAGEIAHTHPTLDMLAVLEKMNCGDIRL